jgi:hypothetical protein
MKTTLFVSSLALSLLASTSQAIDLPPVKEGQWATHTVMTQNPSGAKTELDGMVCRSHASDKQVYEDSKKRAGCTTINESVIGNSWTLQMRCSTASSVQDVKVVASASGDSSLHSETRMTLTPPAHGIAEIVRIADSKFVGSCPSGAHPGQ